MSEKAALACILAIACGCSKNDSKETPAPPAAGSAPSASSSTGSGSGIGSGGSSTGSGSSATADNGSGAAACADRAARLGKRLQELAAVTPGFMPLHPIDAPTAAGKPFDTRGFVVAIDKDGKLFTQGAAFADMKAASEWLRTLGMQAGEATAMAGAPLQDAMWPVYVWADAKAPAGLIAQLVAAAAADSEHFKPRLLVTSKTAMPPEGELSADLAAIAKKQPSNEPASTQYVVDQLKGAMGDCKPTILSLGTLSTIGLPAKQSETLIKDLPAGLVKCACKIPNPDVFDWGMHVWFGSSAPSLAWIDMPKLKKGDKKPIGALVK
jgi:hypothetical protein